MKLIKILCKQIHLNKLVPPWVKYGLFYGADIRWTCPECGHKHYM